MKNQVLSFSPAPVSMRDIVEHFLIDQGWRNESGYNLRSYQGMLLSYDGTRYIKYNKHDLEAHLFNYLNRHSGLASKATQAFVNNLLSNLHALIHVDSTFQLPGFLDSDLQKGSLISLSNGLLSVEDWIYSKRASLLPHTSSYLCTTSLPFPFDENATCPTWDKFLARMVPDFETSDLLQEWFGLNLIYDCSFQKFAILYGEGANGKSVICVVLRALLGDDNVSAVGLEAFDPKRTFPLAATMGKLANVVEEIGEVNSIGEGMLKQFVSGGVMTIERKGIDAFSLFPTARLTFATNILPRFADRSDGTWRRIIAIPLTEQILNEGEQNKNLVNTRWWHESGELPGIFLWALEGLRRLKARGNFVLPERSKVALEQYKLDSNPAKAFLRDYCKFDPSKQSFSHDVYANFSDYCSASGSRPLNAQNFAQEVQRVFPNVRLTNNPRRRGEGKPRSRVWEGLAMSYRSDVFAELES